jgi:hypothetical protein
MESTNKQGLEYERASHLHCQITLRSGRKVQLESLSQSSTYAGWLEGSPRAEVNERIIDAAVPPRAVLLRPKRRDYLREPGDCPDPANATEWLPGVTCTARFTSARNAKDSNDNGSFLTVVWYQDEFALPIDDAALSAIAELDWAKLASDAEDD